MTHLWCKCNHCDGGIEFPAEGLGHEVDCPHCHGTTNLSSMPRPLSELKDPQITVPSNPTRDGAYKSAIPPCLPRVVPPANLLIPCKTCGQTISPTATSCPRCGEQCPGVQLKCWCGSNGIQRARRGFDSGEAFTALFASWIGIFVFGRYLVAEGFGPLAPFFLFLMSPAALLAGRRGQNRVYYQCTACGKNLMLADFHTWKPGGH